jgi:hypothetical protein
MHLHNRVAIQKDKPKKLKKVEESILFEMFFRVGGEGEVVARSGLWHQTLVHVLDDKTSIVKDLVYVQHSSRRSTLMWDTGLLRLTCLSLQMSYPHLPSQSHLPR